MVLYLTDDILWSEGSENPLIANRPKNQFKGSK